MKLKRIILLTAFVISNINTIAQEEQDRPEGHSHVSSPHAISFMVGYAWIPAIVDKVDLVSEVQVVPTLGLDYGYFFNHQWGVGIVNDIEFARYFVEDDDGALIERENKYIGAVTAIWEPLPWLAIFAGPGIEVDKHRSFPLLKTGIELIKRLDNGWSWSVNASVDFNEIYNTYSGGIMIGKRLP